MKIAFLGVNSCLSNTNKQEEIIDFLKINILKIGEQASLVSYFNNSLDNFKNVIQENFNIIFCIGTDSAIYNYNIKDNLSKIFGKKLDKNFSCESSLKKHCEIKSIEYSSTEELMVSIPSDSIPLCDSGYYDNGFIYRHNSTYIIYFPNDIAFIKSVYDPIVLPMLKDIILKKSEVVVLRCYGILEKDIRGIISTELSSTDIEIQILSNRLDNAIYIRYNANELKLSQDIIAEVCSKLSKFIYSTEDTNLYETAINLLKLQNKKLVIAETITYGNTTLQLSKYDHKVIEKSYVFNNFDSLASTLKLESRIVNQFGKYSVNTVYELDNLLLQNSASDISIFVLGDKSIDLCYIAIGDIDGIHVYKNKIISFDNNVINTLTDTTLFYLIKKLRQNDLQFR